LTCEMMFNEPVTHVSEHPLPMSPGRTSSRATQYAAASRFDHECLWNTGSSAFAEDDD
jgi:hypothetical protein